jgi:hypothetical protein
MRDRLLSVRHWIDRAFGGLLIVLGPCWDWPVARADAWLPHNQPIFTVPATSPPAHTAPHAL